MNLTRQPFASKYRTTYKKLMLGSAILTALALSACGSTPVQQDSQAPKLSSGNIESYLEDTAKTDGSEKVTRQLNAAEYFLKNNDLVRAHLQADSIDQSQANEHQYLRLALLRGNIALKDGEPYLAQRYWFDSRLDQIQASTAKQQEQQIELFDRRASLMFDQANYLQAFEQRLKLDQLLKNDEARAQLNHDLLWEYLAELPQSELSELAKTETDSTKVGWYSLAALSKSNGANFRQQIIDINHWRSIWPDHPANHLLPADLQLILQLVDAQAQQLAVLLPLSGKLASIGAAIREGVLAAYYNDLSDAYSLPEIRFYDTNEQDVNSVYDQAVSEGAELVIGPLSKDKLRALSARSELPVTTFALNAINDKAVDIDATAEQTLLNSDAPPAQTSPENTSARSGQADLFQFSLSIESEAQQIALKAWRDGHRRAMILVPDNTWGGRGANAFSQKWEELGGAVLVQQSYRDKRNYSNLVETAVGLKTSKQRRSEIQNFLGQSFEFEPRRRKDIDFIFMLARPTQARQLIPLLSYHYAGDIPVYASSQVYEGPNRKGLADLNGLRFSTMPWFLDSKLAERRAIAAYGDNSPALQQFYALGVDAYHIYPRLEQLKQIRQAQFYGSTGKLSVNQDLHIVRQQSFGEIQQGRAIELKIENKDQGFEQ
ncbi:penicillin-binding protein activator [Agaribacterium haliotis]|uniref:penicillin-binding protein activator n=1 Tax=Agaribacterium haliotis TaxID=2013869 RepID=UPI000BB530CE|nr:penicillin-binding protein activator [Agaribacterium haliotis]